MILSKKQEEGLQIAVDRYKANEPWTCISGYAGSGKSTLIKFIISALDIDPEEDVCYVAYTGKAATVLQQKGCPNAMTAHKLLYYAKPMPNGTYKFSKKPRIDYKVVVIDEVSMLPKEMWDLLLSHKAYVIAAGDPEQLPPVDKDADNHVLDNPHVFLDEIMRQAQDSEIIRLSMHVREGKPLSAFKAEGAQVQLYSPHQVISGMYSWADQILCATNNKRNQINNLVRQMKGFGMEPCIGDKVVSLNNHWDFMSDGFTWPLTNGSIGHISSYERQKISFPYYITAEPVEYMLTNIELEDGEAFMSTPIDYLSITTGKPALSPKQSYLLRKRTEFEPPYDFAYAYAITTHKAQGSEWDKVLVFEEAFPFVGEEHRRWLYTAITRAKEKLVIITKD